MSESTDTLMKFSLLAFASTITRDESSISIFLSSDWPINPPAILCSIDVFPKPFSPVSTIHFVSTGILSILIWFIPLKLIISIDLMHSGITLYGLFSSLKNESSDTFFI